MSRPRSHFRHTITDKDRPRRCTVELVPGELDIRPHVGRGAEYRSWFYHRWSNGTHGVAFEAKYASGRHEVVRVTWRTQRIRCWCGWVDEDLVVADHGHIPVRVEYVYEHGGPEGFRVFLRFTPLPVTCMCDTVHYPKITCSIDAPGAIL